MFPFYEPYHHCHCRPTLTARDIVMSDLWSKDGWINLASPQIDKGQNNG